MDKMQTHTYPDQHLEESSNPTTESSREYGSSPAHYTPGPTDRHVPITPAIPTETFSLETPPRDLSVPDLNVEVSPTNSCHNSIKPMCRICYEGDTEEELISPCRCNGSLALVHKVCLERWLNMSHCDKCELCCFIFNIKRTPRPFWQFAVCGNSKAIWSIIDMCVSFIMTILAALSVYYFIRGMVSYRQCLTCIEFEYSRAIRGQCFESDRDAASERSENFIDWYIIGFVMLGFVLVGVHLANLILTIKGHVNMWQHWQLANQDIVLAETSEGQVAFSKSTDLIGKWMRKQVRKFLQY